MRRDSAREARRLAPRQPRQQRGIARKAALRLHRPGALPRGIAAAQRMRRRHLRQHQGVGRDEAQRQRGGRAAGEGAAGAVAMSGGNARQCEPAAGLRRRDPVDDLPVVVGAVAAGDADGVGAALLQGARKCWHGVERRLRLAQQRRRLVAVRRHQRRTRQQPAPVRHECRLVDERGAAAGAQHRVHHQIDRCALAQAVDPARNALDLRHAAEQPSLDDLRRHVAGQCRELRVQHLDADGCDARYRLRVLRRHRGDHRAQVHAEGIGRALVGCEARAAPAVGAGDAPDDGARHGSAPSRNGSPLTGVLATAKSCLAITPACQAPRPASIARRKACAIATGSRACATAEFSSTAS